jgi:hypothetical protein
MEMSLYPVWAVGVQYCPDAAPPEASACSGYRILSFSPRSPLGEFRSPSTACCFETETFLSSACCYRQAFLGDMRRFWSRWRHALILVQPDPVVRWHRAGFKLYWTWLSRHRERPGRKCVSVALRELIFRMVAENPTWGEPRIHGALRWMKRAPRNSDPAKRWVAF